LEQISLLSSEEQERPLIVCKGENFENIEGVFVKLNSNILEFPNIFNAVFYAFLIQSFFKTCDFENSCSYIWTLLDKAVFKAEVFKIIPKVSTILTELKL
jgi:hypothetical protein